MVVDAESAIADCVFQLLYSVNISFNLYPPLLKIKIFLIIKNIYILLL
jgi:hypothetical protein